MGPPSMTFRLAKAMGPAAIDRGPVLRMRLYQVAIPESFPNNPPYPCLVSTPAMTDNANPAAIIPSNPQAELEAMIALSAGLTQMALAMAKHCLDVQTRLPGVVNAAIANGLAVLVPAAPVWVRGVARTPAQLEAAHPPGSGDDVAYHVVTAGREPGLYTSVNESDDQVLGVPDSRRKRQGSRAEALAYYRIKWDEQKVVKWVSQTAPAIPSAASGSAAPVVHNA
ncbi:hypothetical protein C8R43DRAFT_1128266 [Mycena crocata]|nr:hypothetical protein C8R43DRAFT_1128266 [Mycena crocata]